MKDRYLSDIAREIIDDWKNVHFSAEPYLVAMTQLKTVDDNYGEEGADMIVRYFLGNARTWRGEKARENYGRFHCVIKKIDGVWKIAQDWDDDEINGRKVSAEDWAKEAPLKF